MNNETPILEEDFTKIESENSELTNDYVPQNDFSMEKYDPRPQEDTARRVIAYVLLGMLAGVLLFSFVSLIIAQVKSNKEDVDSLIKVLQIILSPLIALVSAATGFYYGSKKDS